MSENLKAVIFAGVLSLVCCLVITAASTGLKPYQDANVKLDIRKNILRAVGLLEDKKKYTGEAVNQLFESNITIAWLNDAGVLSDTMIENGETLYPLYMYKKEQMGKKVLESYIIPLNVRGLWGKINGYIALKNDGKTVAGFSVSQHQETPGLGGEIESSWFRNNFKNKSIVDSSSWFVSVSVVKGKADVLRGEKQKNAVDGISGATLTGSFLSQGIKETLLLYEPFSKTLRIAK